MERDISGPLPEAGLTHGRARLPLAIIANEQTPYRLHLHRRICREMPEIELWSIFTNELASSPWQYQDDREIRSVLFGDARPGSGAVGEWGKGGRIIRWLEGHGIRAIILYGYNNAARFRIVRWAAARGVACFLFGDSNIRCDRATGFKGLVKRSYVPWILGQTTGVFHCGRLGREYFLNYGVPTERLYAFPYEPDYALFERPSSDRRSAARRRYGLSEGRRHLLFTGRMIAAKRPDLLLAAFENIAAIRPDWDLVMVGDGPLRSRLENHGGVQHGQRVHWLGFIADAAELAALYAVCDVFVLPSDFEPWGVVLTEAATRLALVASSAVGAAADVIEDGLNGRVFPQGDADGLRDALLDVTTPGRTDAMKAASPGVLRRWRRSADPVVNLRLALQSSGLLPAGDVNSVHAG